MTNLSASLPRRRVSVWRLGTVWLFIAWERLWNALWPASGVVGLFLFLGLIDFLPSLAGWLHVLLLVVMAIGAVWAFGRSLRGFRLPLRSEIDRRLETDSALSHRPLEALEDSQAAGIKEPGGQALWALHQMQMAEAAAKLQFCLPRPSLFRRDPWAVRIALVISIGIAAIFAEGDITERFKRSVQPNWQADGLDLKIAADAWITPPEYTRYPPIFLTSETDYPDSGAIRTIKVPKASKLTAQLTGRGSETVLVVDGKSYKFSQKPGDVAQIERVLMKSGNLAIYQSGRVLARWVVDIIPDEPPTVEFVREPVKSKRNALRFHFNGQDDYGVVKIVAAIRRHSLFESAKKDSDAEDKTRMFEVELPLSGNNTRDFSTTVFKDLTAHRWAGLPVEVQLIAIDALGQNGISKKVETVLPERRFNHPTAQSIIKERKRFVDAPEAYGPRAGVMLDNLSWHYDEFNGDIVTFLGLSVAGRRLMDAGQLGNVPAMEKLLWDIALRIEDGRLSLSERAMRRAKDDLLSALNKNASDTEIERLLENYRRTLSDYFERLAESLKELEKETSESLGLGQKSQMLRRQDLMRMLKDIRKFIQNGQRQKAREMLAQLQELIESMRVKRFAKQSEATRRAIRTVNDLKRLVKSQQELLDKTYRIARDRNQIKVKKQRIIPYQGFVPFSQDQKGRVEMNKRGIGKKQHSKQSLTDEIGQQERLRGQLGDVMRRVVELNVPIPGEMGLAETSMRKSSMNLKIGAAGKSVTHQNDVIKELTESLKSTMAHLASQSGEDPFDMDDDWLQGGESKNDPFGRPKSPNHRKGAGGGPNLGEEVEILGIQDTHNAKQIRDELRRRAGEYKRSKQEREYYKRLLKRF